MTNIDRLIDVAAAQIGITEYPSGSNNVVYNTWFYGREVYDGLWSTQFPWCMAFVQWCFHCAGMTLPYKTAGCYPFLEWYKTHEPRRIVAVPRRGDIAIYSIGSGHTGIVESVSGNEIQAIEGNTSLTSNDNGGAVMRRTRNISTVKAFIRAVDEICIDTEEKEDNMSYELFKEYMDRYRTELQTNDAGAWSADDRIWAVNSNIFLGSGLIDGKPNYMWKDYVTREQLAAIAHRIVELSKQV